MTEAIKITETKWMKHDLRNTTIATLRQLIIIIGDMI